MRSSVRVWQAGGSAAIGGHFCHREPGKSSLHDRLVGRDVSNPDISERNHPQICSSVVLVSSLSVLPVLRVPAGSNRITSTS